MPLAQFADGYPELLKEFLQPVHFDTEVFIAVSIVKHRVIDVSIVGMLPQRIVFLDKYDFLKLIKLLNHMEVLVFHGALESVLQRREGIFGPKPEIVDHRSNVLYTLRQPVKLLFV